MPQRGNSQCLEFSRLIFAQRQVGVKSVSIYHFFIKRFANQNARFYLTTHRQFGLDMVKV
jgi:hypothetical protein